MFQTQKILFVNDCISGKIVINIERIENIVLFGSVF